MGLLHPVGLMSPVGLVAVFGSVGSLWVWQQAVGLAAGCGSGSSLWVWQQAVGLAVSCESSSRLWVWWQPVGLYKPVGLVTADVSTAESRDAERRAQPHSDTMQPSVGCTSLVCGVWTVIIMITWTVIRSRGQSYGHVDSHMVTWTITWTAGLVDRRAGACTK